MPRLPVLLLAVVAAFTAACGGVSDTEPDPTAPPTRQPSPSPTAPSNATQVSGSSTTTPTSVPATSTSEATATPTTAPPGATPTAAATAATTVPPPPTSPPATGNPLSASMGVTGTARFFWSPSQVTIAPGGVVTFAWSGNAAHDVSIPSIGFEGQAKVSASYTVAFPSAGKYEVICVIHAATMRGTVTVQ